jgi:hypothetical protein
VIPVCDINSSGHTAKGGLNPRRGGEQPTIDSEPHCVQLAKHAETEEDPAWKRVDLIVVQVPSEESAKGRGKKPPIRRRTTPARTANHTRVEAMSVP